MSFLPGRLAATENAFFREQSKAAARLLKGKLGPEKMVPSESATPPVLADTLPEILMHALPSSPPGSTSPSAAMRPPSLVPERSTLAGISHSIIKQAVPPADGPQLGRRERTKNDLVELLSTSVPSQTTFGPRRWIVEHTLGCQPVPSTANAAKWDAEPFDPSPTEGEVRAGMLQVAKAFGVATTLIFGGGAALIGYVGHRLEWNSLEDVKNKSREAVRPNIETMRERVKPTQQWALQIGGKWKMEEAERQAVGVEFAQALGVHSVKQMMSTRSAEQASQQQRRLGLATFKDIEE